MSRSRKSAGPGGRREHDPLTDDPTLEPSAGGRSDADHADVDDADTELEDDADEAAAESDHPTREESDPEEADSGGADAALGLYLRQMGAIPLLNREQELALARRLEFARSRYRHAVLFSPRVLELVYKTFASVR